MFRVLITGSNGLLGQTLVALLKHKEVVVLGTSIGENRNPNLEQYQKMDITSKENVQRVCKAFAPDIIVNTAAMTQVDICEEQKQKCWDINVTGVDNLVAFSKESGAYFLQLSTDFIFDGKDGPYCEEAQPNPLSYYGESKLAAEKIVQHQLENFAIARTILVYGEVEAMSRSNIVLWVKGQLTQKQPIRVVNDQFRSPTNVIDLAKGCWLLMMHQEKGVFNVAGPETLSVYDFACSIAKKHNLDRSLISAISSSELNQKAPRPPRTGLKISKMQKTFGYSPLRY